MQAHCLRRHRRRRNLRPRPLLAACVDPVADPPWRASHVDGGFPPSGLRILSAEGRLGRRGQQEQRGEVPQRSDDGRVRGRDLLKRGFGPLECGFGPLRRGGGSSGHESMEHPHSMHGHPWCWGVRPPTADGRAWCEGEHSYAKDGRAGKAGGRLSRWCDRPLCAGAGVAGVRERMRRGRELVRRSREQVRHADQSSREQAIRCVRRSAAWGDGAARCTPHRLTVRALGGVQAGLVPTRMYTDEAMGRRTHSARADGQWDTNARRAAKQSAPGISTSRRTTSGRNWSIIGTAAAGLGHHPSQRKRSDPVMYRSIACAARTLSSTMKRPGMGGASIMG